MIGDVIKVSGSNFSGITGQVEQVTLRVTVLRDTDGTVHFVPHGQLTLVSNMTHGWSQAVFDLNVASSEHVERVRDLFFELARQLRELSHERAWAIRNNGRAATGLIMLGNVDVAGQHDYQAMADITGFRESLARL